VAARELDFSSTTTGNRLLSQFPLGFDTKGPSSILRILLAFSMFCRYCSNTGRACDTTDAVVNKVALVLKMLYLSDFRDLQNEVNSLLVLVQECTANP
jgi:hypothetical protein